MTGFMLDLRAGARGLLRSPGYTLLAVLMLALGLGASTAIFGIVRSVLLRPLAYDQPGQLLYLCEENPRVGYCTTAPPNAYDWAARSRTLAAVGVVRPWQYSVRRGDTSEGLSVGILSPELFDVLRVRPQLGRLLQPADQQGEGARVVVLADEYWRTAFGADPGVLGTTLLLEGEPYEIVGVTPPGLKVPGAGRAPLFKPLHIDPRSEEHRHWRGFTALARMRDGVTEEAARADLARVAAELAAEHPETNEGWGVRVQSLHAMVTGDVRPALLLFSGAVALVLLIVCANAANLLLARAARREHELAVRVANGASRGRLVRQLVIETGLVALAAAACGYLLASWGTGALLALAPRQLPRSSEIALGPSNFAFALGLALIVTLLVSVLPALWASRTDVHRLLRSGDGRSTRGLGAGRGALVVAEVALSVMLLTAAGVLLRSLAHQLQWDPGFSRDHLVLTQVFVPRDKYADADARTAFYDRAREALAAMPGVSTVGAASAGPIFGGLDAFNYRVDTAPSAEPRSVRAFDVDERFFETLGLRIVRGRAIEPTDAPGTPDVAVVNEAFARLNWGSADPLGHTIDLVEGETTLQVVGVVQDITPFPGDPLMNGPALYTAQRQAPRGATYFVLRTATDPAALLPRVQETLLALEPQLDISSATTMDDQLALYTAGPRFNLLIIGMFAVVALLLALAGLYGVIAYTAAQRTREFGIRIALGGQQRNIIGMVLRQAGALVLGGVLLGAAGAAASARLLDSMVYGVRLRDPVLYAAVALLLATVALLATLVPAVKAARRDPVGVLRGE